MQEQLRVSILVVNTEALIEQKDEKVNGINVRGNRSRPCLTSWCDLYESQKEVYSSRKGKKWRSPQNNCVRRNASSKQEISDFEA
jgi:hypothetical protein